MKILIEFSMDGYDTNADEKEACVTFLLEQLDFSASSLNILWAEDTYDMGDR